VHRIVIVIAMLGAAASAGCKSDTSRSRTERLDDHVVSDVVARVGGRSIGASEVESRMAADEVGAEAALERLVDETLLAQEAERLGFTEDWGDQRSIERLMVRTMLHDLEEKNTPKSISEEEVREVYSLHADEFRVRERRRSWHILVEDESEAAEALAGSILREIQKAGDPRTVFVRYADGEPEGLAFDVRAEDLPAITEKAGMKKPYKDELFAAKSLGPLKNVVKTSYGWHAIVVAEILPEEVRTVDEAEDDIREQVSQTKRFREIVAIVQGLEAQGLVHYDEQGVKRLLSMPGLPERTE
jgi:parvulin-like peptidyl-prolyl isomerase